jgi:hypothetical protein
MESVIKYIETVLGREMTIDEKTVFDIALMNGRRDAIVNIRNIIDNFEW